MAYEYLEFDVVFQAMTDKAALLYIPGLDADPLWVPLSQIEEDSIQELGLVDRDDELSVEITTWWLEKQGYAI